MSVKITRMALFKVPPRWLSLNAETDEEVVGWGEPVMKAQAATVQEAARRGPNDRNLVRRHADGTVAEW